MNVLATDPRRAARLVRSSRDSATAGRRRRLSRSALVLLLLRLVGRSGSGRTGGAAGAAAVRRNGLLAYTAGSILLGLGLLAWTSTTVRPLPGIDPRLGAEGILAGPTGGLLIWLVFGLLGSLRVLRAPGGATMTFHMPFVGAAMILGGPTAGAWVAFLSSIERRELESQPWYGVLANHAVLVIAAVLGGLTTLEVRILLGGSDRGTDMLIAMAAGTAVLTIVSIAMGVVTVLLRDDVSPRAYLELLVAQFGRVTALEAGLVIVLAASWSLLGWWAPLLVGGFVLAVWDNDPMPGPDPLTGLQVRAGFVRRLDAGLGRLRRGSAPGSTLLFLDLDLFKQVNDHYGHAVGDEVLREVGTRLLLQARRPNDLAGRLGGDELALYLPALDDVETAMRRADDVAGALAAPIATSAGPVSVGVSIGVVVIGAWGGVPSPDTILRHGDAAMYHAKRAGSRIHLYDATEPAPFEDDWVDGRR
jgi:diguanylate cyclase (GGDEF)-like protein